MDVDTMDRRAEAAQHKDGARRRENWRRMVRGERLVRWVVFHETSIPENVSRNDSK